LEHALMYMRQNGQTISILFPFSYAFYRRYGWELAFNNVQCHIPITAFKKQRQPSGYVRRIENDDLDVLDTIYTAYARQYSGMLERDRQWWEDRVLKDNHQMAAAYDENDDPVGYVIYNVKQDVLHVRDIA